MTSQKSSTAPANTPDQPASGKGMPPKNPPSKKPHAAQVGKQPDARDGSAQDALELPRDRDEASDMTSGQTSPLIEQAKKDVDKGLKDTSKAVEMDRTYKKL